MSDDIRITSPVKIKDNSKERVAFNLMEHISNLDNASDSEKSNRNYWLTLYRQCYKASSGNNLKSILTEE